MLRRVAILALSLMMLGAPAFAGTRHYVLNPGSSITAVCNSCSAPPTAAEPLTGSFDVTLLPVASVFDVAALTNLSLASTNFAVTGNGFLQRLGTDRQAMVLDTDVNGTKTLFTSGRRQHAGDQDIVIILSSGRVADYTYVLVLSASPVDSQQADADGDTAGDEKDNCPTVANADQSDADHDGIGDACDKCPDTPSGAPVTADGCSVDQLCPCDGPQSGDQWNSQQEYLRCVVKATRRLRHDGQVSRADSFRILRRAAKSACGRTVVALR